MGIGDWFTRRAQDVVNVKDAVKERPAIYVTVNTLINELTLTIESAEDNDENPKAINAAQQLRARLRTAIKQFDDDLKNNKELAIADPKFKPYFRIVQEFADECHDAIHDHQPALMASPTLWEQIKSTINNFFERYTELGPVFKNVELNKLVVDNVTLQEAIKTAKKGTQDEPEKNLFGP